MSAKRLHVHSLPVITLGLGVLVMSAVLITSVKVSSQATKNTFVTALFTPKGITGSPAFSGLFTDQAPRQETPKPVQAAGRGYVDAGHTAQLLMTLE